MHSPASHLHVVIPLSPHHTYPNPMGKIVNMLCSSGSGVLEAVIEARPVAVPHQPTVAEAFRISS